MKHTRLGLLLAVMCLFALSCEQTPDLEQDTGVDKSVISFSPTVFGTGAASETKSYTFQSEDDAVSVPVTLTVVDGIEGTIYEETETKGELINRTGATGTLESFGISEFNAAAYDMSTSPASTAIAANTPIYYSKNIWSTSELCVWGDDQALRFVGAANIPPYCDAIFNGNNGSISLKVKENGSIPACAQDQTDALLGFYEGNGSTEDGGHAIAPITFGHPFTSVEFKLGTMDFEAYGKTFKGIKSISLDGVYSNGTATQTGLLTYSWTASGEMTTYLKPDEGDYLTVGEKDNVIGEPFIIIPQNLTNKSVVVRVVVALGDADGKLEDVVLYSILKSDDWKSGKTNIYTLGTSGKVLDVTVDETFDGKTKSAVALKNTGTCPIYVRAAIIGAWINADGDYLYGWDYDPSATEKFGFKGLVDSSDESQDWIYNAGDGYYYYKNSINPGDYTGGDVRDNLFESFTSPASPDGASHFEMIIMAQGVEADSASAPKAWPFLSSIIE